MGKRKKKIVEKDLNFKKSNKQLKKQTKQNKTKQKQPVKNSVVY